MDKKSLYDELVIEIKGCKRCDLGECLVDGFDPHVTGQGNLDADLFFIAEGPGLQETIHQRPLTPPGKSGVIYEKVLGSLGLTRDQVYTSNTVLCRPPDNRDPEPYECLKCEQFLKRQLDIVKPKLIVTFGRFAASAFLRDFKITRDHGKTNFSDTYNYDVFPLYHPAYVGCYSPQEKREEFKRDLITLKRLLIEKEKI